MNIIAYVPDFLLVTITSGVSWTVGLATSVTISNGNKLLVFTSWYDHTFIFALGSHLDGSTVIYARAGGTQWYVSPLTGADVVSGERQFFMSWARRESSQVPVKSSI